MAEFPSVTVDLSEQLEFPGDSYPLTGKVDVATYTVGEKEYQLQDGIDYDVVFTNAGTGVLLTGMVRAHATGECDRCLEPASFDIAGEIEEFYLFEEPEDPEAYEDGYELLGEDRIVDLGEPINDAVGYGHAVCGALQARLSRSVPHLRLQSQRRAMRLRRPGRGRMGRCHGKSICSIEESQA